MAEKTKAKGDVKNSQEYKDLEEELREESRNYDKEKKHRIRLEKELEAEHNGKEKALKDALEASERFEAAKKAKEKAEQEANQSAARVDAEKKAKEKAQKEAKDAEERFQAEKKKNDNAKKEADRLVGVAEAERKERERLQQELEKATANACNKQNQADRLTKEAKDARTRAEAEKGEKERALQIAKEQETKSAAYEKEKEFYREKSEQLEKQTMELNEKVDQLGEENKKLREEINEVKGIVERKPSVDLQESIAGTEKELTKVKWGPHKDRPWTEEEVKRLRKLVLKSRKDSDGNSINLKILVFGPTGNGKSSLCNGFRSAIRGTEQPTTYYAVADGSESLTSGFQGAQYGDHWIIDMAGIFESRKIDSSSINDILSGKVPFYAEITDNLEVRDRGQMELPPPGKNDVACVVLVLKYEMNLGPEIKRQIDTVIRLAGKGVVSFHLVITRLDDCDPRFNDPKELPHLYESKKVQAAVQRISEETGITPLSISFVKNYVRETETDNNTFILHLRVLEKIIFSATEQVEKRLDQKRQKNMYKYNYCSCRNLFLALCFVLSIISAVVAIFGQKYLEPYLNATKHR